MSPTASSAASKQTKGGFYIGVTCPGCGGKLTIEDDFNILLCSHCGSVLRVVLPDIPPAYLVTGRVNQREIRFSIDRYLKEHSLPLTGGGLQYKYVYYPYWKIDAIQLKVRYRLIEKPLNENDDYDYRDDRYTQVRMEISLTPYSSTFQAGHPLDGVPYSIGLRSQVIRMVPFARDNFQDDYDDLPVIRPLEEVWAESVEAVANFTRLSTSAGGSNRTDLLHPQPALVYFPYVIADSYTRDGLSRFLVDGVSARVHGHSILSDDVSEDTPPEPIELAYGCLEVVFHRCANCGLDLPPVKSFVNVCENCRQVILNDDSDIAVDQLMQADGDDIGNSEFYPFWSFRIGSDADSEIRRLFGGIYDSEWFTVPAFRIDNLEAMYRLSKRVSAALPQLQLIPVEETSSRFLPVTVGASRARDLANVIIFRRRIKNNQQVAMDDITFAPTEARLVYLPFRPEHYFYVDSVLKAVTFEKSIIK